MSQPLTDAMRQQIRAQLTAKPKASNKPRERRTTAGLWSRPFASEALGINPDQREEATAHLRAHGITADYDDEGRCIVTSDKQYQDIARVSGLRTGRDGYEVTNESGAKILTGRQQAQQREEFKREIRRWGGLE